MRLVHEQNAAHVVEHSGANGASELIAQLTLAEGGESLCVALARDGHRTRVARGHAGRQLEREETGAEQLARELQQRGAARALRTDLHEWNGEQQSIPCFPSCPTDQ